MSLADHVCVPLRVPGRCEWCNGMAALGADLCLPCGAAFAEDKLKLEQLMESDRQASLFWAHFKSVGG
jgi:hypothetical protein